MEMMRKINSNLVKLN